MGHGPAQGRKGTQRPTRGSQNCPLSHTTPAQGTGMQPGTQRPAMQVSFARHVTPAQGSRRGAQNIEQVNDSPPHTEAVISQPLGAQCPARQRVPSAHSLCAVQAAPNIASGGNWPFARASLIGMSKLKNCTSLGSPAS